MCAALFDICLTETGLRGSRYNDFVDIHHIKNNQLFQNKRGCICKSFSDIYAELQMSIHVIKFYYNNDEYLVSEKKLVTWWTEARQNWGWGHQYKARR